MDVFLAVNYDLWTSEYTPVERDWVKWHFLPSLKYNAFPVTIFKDKNTLNVKYIMI